jgi:hypothetical protein
MCLNGPDSLSPVAKKSRKGHPHSELKFFHSKADCEVLQLKKLKHQRVQNQFAFPSAKTKDSSDCQISSSQTIITPDQHFP